MAANLRREAGDQRDRQTAQGPGLTMSIGEGCGQYLGGPLATSRNTRPAPAVRRAAICAATLWPPVDTRAYPKIIPYLWRYLLQRRKGNDVNGRKTLQNS